MGTPLSELLDSVSADTTPSAQDPTPKSKPLSEAEAFLKSGYSDQLEQEFVGVPREFGESKYDKDIKFISQLDDLNEFRAQQQTSLDKFGNTVAKFTTSLGSNTLGGIVGLPVGVVEGVYNAGKKGIQSAQRGDSPLEVASNTGAGLIKGFTHNEVYLAMGEFQDKVSENFPHYYTQAEREKSFMQQLGTYNFWGDKAVNGLSFLASAILTEGASMAIQGAIMGSRVAAGSKLLQYGSEGSRAATLSKAIATGVADVSTTGRVGTLLRQLGTGAGFESAMESREAYDNIIDNFLTNGKDLQGNSIAKRFEANPDLTREQKLSFLTEDERWKLEKEATSLQNSVFAGNMVVVGLSNMVMLGNLYGAGITKRMDYFKGLRTSAAESATELGGKIAARAPLAGKIGSALTSTGVKAGTKWAARGLYEGFEEGSQGFMRSLATNYAEMSSLSNDGFMYEVGAMDAAFAQAYDDTFHSTEGKTEIFLGALMGLMGVPTKLGGGGMFWTEATAEERAKTASALSLKEFQKKHVDAITEVAKANPNFGKGLVVQMVAVANMHKRQDALDQAIKDGDFATAKSLEMDNSLDMFIAMDLTGKLSSLEKDFEKNLKLDGDAFKAAFGYAEEMTTAQIEERKVQLNNSFKSSIKSYRDSVEAVDKVYSLTNDAKHMQMANSNSPAFRRRVMIHAAMSAENRDMREKAIIAKIAKLVGGDITSKDGLVDTITIQTPDGPKVLNIGTMNAYTIDEKGVMSVTTVESQIQETAKRLQALAAIPEKQRPEDYNQVVEDLTTLFDVLKKESNKKKPVLSLFLENGNSSEAKTLDEWIAQDPLRSKDKEDLQKLLGDARRLRVERHEFAAMFQKLTTEEGHKEMVKKNAELSKSLEAAKAANKQTASEKQEISDRKVEFKSKIRLYQASLDATVADIKDTAERLEELRAQLESNIFLVDDLQPWVEALEKAEPGSTQIINSVTGESVDLITAEDFKKLSDSTKAEVEELTKIIEENPDKLAKWVPAAEDLKSYLELLLSNTPDPNNYEAYKVGEDRKKAMDMLKEVLGLSDDFNSDSFLFFSVENEEVKLTMQEVMSGIDEGIVALQEVINTSETQLADLIQDIERYDALIESLGEGAMDFELANLDLAAIADREEVINLKKTIEGLKVNLTVEVERRDKLAKAYETIKKLQAYTNVRNWDPETAHPSSVQMFEESIEEELYERAFLEKAQLKLEDHELNKPDYRDGGMQNAFFKTAGNHMESLKTYITLYKKTDRTADEEKQYKNAKSQIIWYDWLARSAQDFNDPTSSSPVSSFTKLMLVTPKNLENIPDEIREELEGTFYNDTEVKAVAVHVESKTVGKKVTQSYSVVRHDGQMVYTALMDPKAVNDDGDDRFTNKEIVGKTLSVADKEKKRVEYAVWKQGLHNLDDPIFVGINASMNGEIVPLEKDAVANVAGADALGTNNFSSLVMHVATKAPGSTNTRASFKAPGVGPSTSVRVGDVVVYNPSKGKNIIAHRQTLGEETATTVSRLFQLYLVKYTEALAVVGDAVKAKNIAKNTVLLPATKSTDKTPGTEEVKLWEHIEDLVMIKSEGSPFTLDSKIIGYELQILFGDKTFEEKGTAHRMSLADFQDPAKQDMFLQFLKTKYHQVKKTTVDSATKPETKPGKKDSKGKSTNVPTGKYVAAKPWLKIKIDKDLKIGKPIKYSNYVSYLLSSDKKDNPTPALLFAQPFKGTPLTPMIYGGGLFFNDKEDSDPKRDIRYKKHKFKPSKPAGEYESALGTVESYVAAEQAYAVQDEIEAEEIAIELTGKPKKVKATTATATTATLGMKPPTQAEMAALAANAPKVDLSALKALRANDGAGGKEVNLGAFIEEVTADSILADTRPVEEKYFLDDSVVDGKPGQILYYVPTWFESNEDFVLVGMGTPGNKGFFRMPVHKETVVEILRDFIEPNNLSLLQVGEKELSTIMDNINEEIARVLEMTPLEITMTQRLIGTMDRKAVAQLTDFGKVLYSQFAPGGALYHEAFHNISLYMLSPRDSKVLYNKVREIPGTITTFRGETKKLSELTDKEAEEWLAEEFRHSLLDPNYKVAETSVTDTRSTIRKFFDLIKSFLRVRLGLNKNFEFDPKMSSIEGLFSSIKGGKFLKVGRHAAKRHAGIYDMLAPEGNAQVAPQITVQTKIDLLDTFLSELGSLIDSPRNPTAMRDLFIGMSRVEERGRLQRLYDRALTGMRVNLLFAEEELLTKTEGKEKPIEEVVPYTPTVVPEQKKVSGENISSKGSEFAKKLTNVGNTVGLTYKGKQYVNSEHAYQTWKSGEFNQAGYDLRGGKVRGGKIGDTFSIMTGILTEKLKQHPDLIQGIEERGGLEYLKKSTHNVIGDKFWESAGQNKFMEALIKASKGFLKEPTSSPVLGKQPAAKKKPSSELALDFMKLDAVQTYLTIVGRSKDQPGNTDLIKELANEHFKDMKFNIDGEEVEESYNTAKDASYDRNAHSRSAADVAESAIRLLLGTIPSQNTNTTTLNGVHPLSLESVEGGKKVYGIMKTVQDWTINSNSLSEVESILESKRTQYPTKYPWVPTLLSRIRNLRQIPGRPVEGFDINRSAQMLMLKSIESQLTKARQEPALTLVEARTTEDEEASSSRVRILILTEEAAARSIARTWEGNLKDIALKGEHKYVKLDGNNYVFNPSAQFSKTAKNWNFNSVALTAGKMDVERLVNSLKVLGIEFSNPENLPGYGVAENNLDSRESEFLKELRGHVEMIFSALSSSTKDNPVSSNIFSREEDSPVATRARKLVDMELEYGDHIADDSYYVMGEMDYAVAEGNYITTVANTANLRSLKHLDPLVAPFTRNSLVLNNQTDKLKVVRLMGIQQADKGQKGRKITKLSPAELLSQKLSVVMKGLSLLPQTADKNTVLAVDLNVWGTKGLVNNGRVSTETAKKTLMGYLEDEILSSVVGMRELKGTKDYQDGVKNLASKLRFFEGLLSEEENNKVISLIQNSVESDKIYKEFKKSGKSATLTKFMKVNEGKFFNEIEKAFIKDIKEMFQDLQDLNLIKHIPATKKLPGSVIITGIDSDLLQGKTDAPNRMSMEDFGRALENIILRDFIGSVEVFKVFFNDPAFYGDLFKRTGGAVGPKTMGSTDSQLIEFFGSDTTSKGWTTAEGEFTGLLIKEPKYLAQGFSMDGLSQDIADMYDEPVDMADGAIFVLPEMYRFFQGLTNQWTLDQEEVYQNRKLGNTTPIKNGTFYPAKLQYNGPAYKKPLTKGEREYVIQAFLKMSVIPIDESMVPAGQVRYPNLATITKFMRDNSTGMLILPSAFKVGGVTEDGNSLPKMLADIYNSTGEIQFDSAPHEVKAVAFTNFDIRYMGTQVKISPEGKGNVTAATQVRTQILSDLFENGELSLEIFPDGSNKKLSLSEATAQKAKREEVLELIKDYNTTLNEMTKKAVADLFQSLKIEPVLSSTNEIGYRMTSESYKAVLDILTAEGVNKQIGEQLMEGIAYAKTQESFKMEHFVSSGRMEKMLFSHMEMKVIKGKYTGGQMVAVPELGYEYTIVKNELGQDVPVDGRLKLGEDPVTGKYVMEVMLPHYFKQFFGEDLEITNEGIIDPNSKDRSIFPGSAGLLDMLGVRIPTDGLHSVEVIRVKDFLPQIAGPRVVVPALLVKKAGSDFDIDKLTMYFQNFKVVNNKLVREQFYSELKDWYEATQQQGLTALEEARTNLMEANAEYLFNLRAQEFTKTLSKIFLGGEDLVEDVTEETINKLQKEMQRAERVMERFFYQNEDGSIGLNPFEYWEEENPNETIWSVQTKGAIQNHLMDVMKDMIQLKERVNNLMSPVSTPTLSASAETVMDLQNAGGNPHKIPNLKKNAGFLHKRLSLMMQTLIGHAYWSGKAVTGISAQHSTHHVKSQMAGLKLVPHMAVTRPTGEAIEVFYHFKEFETLDREQPIDLGRIKSLGANGQRISDVLSQIVNGAVDTVNTPILHILNMGPDAASAGIALVRAGVPVESVIAMLNQPIIRKFLERTALSKGIVHKTFVAREVQEDEKTIVNNLKEWLGDNVEDVTIKGGIYFTQKELEDMIGKSPEGYIPGKDGYQSGLSPEQKGYQIQLLEDFRGYLGLGDALSSLVNYQAFDTKPPKGRWDVVLRAKMYEDLLKKNYFINAEAVTDSPNLFMKEFKDFSYLAPSIVKDLFESSEYGTLYNQVMNVALEQITGPKMFLSYDDRLAVLENIDQDFTSYVLQRVQVDGLSVGMNAQRLMYGKGSTAVRVLSILKDEKHPLHKNYYINQIKPIVQGSEVAITGPVSGVELPPDHLELSTKGLTEADNKLLVEAFGEIVDYDNETSGKLAEDLIETALLQAGISTSPYSFLHTIPGDIYAKKVGEIFKNYKGKRRKLLIAGEADGFDNAISVLNTIMGNRTGSDLIAKDSKRNREEFLYTIDFKKIKGASIAGSSKYSSILRVIVKTPGEQNEESIIFLPQSQYQTFLNFTGESIVTNRKKVHAVLQSEKLCK